MVALIIVLLLLSIAAGIGLLVMRILRINGELLINLTLGTALGLGVLSYITFAFGLIGLLYKWVMWVVTVILIPIAALGILRSLKGCKRHKPNPDKLSSWTKLLGKGSASSFSTLPYLLARLRHYLVVREILFSYLEWLAFAFIAWCAFFNIFVWAGFLAGWIDYGAVEKRRYSGSRS